MSKPQSKNDLNTPVPQFCFEIEVDRRTSEGRVRSPQEFLTHFFPHDGKAATDRIFHFLPRDVRGPILTSWGIRGQKSAVLDDDEKVRSVVHDAFVAGDIDASAFEEALGPETIMRWIDLSDWWSFWRGGKLTKYALHKALEAAYELGVFDADWFIEAVRGQDGRLKGTEVLAEGLSKAELTEWVRRIHEGKDGSPKGLVAALGWKKIVEKTADPVLIAALDAIAAKVGLVGAPAKAVASGDAKVEAPARQASNGGKGGEEELQGELAAGLFRDDEMIPVSASTWGDEGGTGNGAVEVAPPEPAVARKNSKRPPRSSVAPEAPQIPKQRGLPAPPPLRGKS